MARSRHVRDARACDRSRGRRRSHYNGDARKRDVRRGAGRGPGRRTRGRARRRPFVQRLCEFSSATPVRRYAFNLTAQTELCRRLYGVAPDPTYLTRRFGGYKIPEESRTSSSRPARSTPWTGGTFTEAEPHVQASSSAPCRRARTTPTCARLATTTPQTSSRAGRARRRPSRAGSRRGDGVGGALRRPRIASGRLPVDAFRRAARRSFPSCCRGLATSWAGSTRSVRVYEERARTSKTCDPAWPLSIKKQGEQSRVNLGEGTTGDALPRARRGLPTPLESPSGARQPALSLCQRAKRHREAIEQASRRWRDSVPRNSV